jgi:hypothetical protein
MAKYPPAITAMIKKTLRNRFNFTLFDKHLSFSAGQGANFTSTVGSDAVKWM